MRKNTVPSFIEKTWDILQDQLYAPIMRWAEDGNSFLILDEQKLCSEVLPKYFKHSNFSSFIRQLNMYNFHKKKNFGNAMEFYHRLFRKDQRQLLIGIKRKPSEAQIEFGEELIRRMTKEASRSNSRENSQSNENINYLELEAKTNKEKDLSQTFLKTFCGENYNSFCPPFWVGMGSPLYQISQQNMQNIPFEQRQQKILTNIILKNPPTEKRQ